ncbi:MAG TPA: PP2C family protein-serine/threonine phosphatase [Bryobacteraceae bacterium]|nr:PP2C family protein-serine/threonine phosphatase [Bryobacteraceae bacterium]
MKRIASTLLLALFLVPSAALGQNALWIDLSGDWRILVNQDQPEFASPDFDDSAWPTVGLPAGERFPNGLLVHSGWMRKKIELPQETDRSNLALTVGTIQLQYEIYINGKRAGASPSAQSDTEAQISRPLSFPLPRFETRALLIAIRLQSGRSMHPLWRIPDRGPYLLTYRINAPLNAGVQAIDRHKVEIAPLFGLAVFFLGIAALSFLGWMGDRKRKELWWFSLVGIGRMGELLSLFQLLTPWSHPFSPRLVILNYLNNGFLFPSFGEVVLRALGVRARWPRWALWLGWAEAPIAYLVGWHRSDSFKITNYWCTCLTLGIILWEWRPRPNRRFTWGEHAIRGALIVPVLQNLDYWSGQVLRTPTLLPGVFFWRGYCWDPYDVFQLPVCVLILALLIRSAIVDRQEQQRLTRELEAARIVQQLLLQGSDLRQPGLVLDAVYQPAQEVGGDFYYVLDGQTIVLGDVSGKGLKAAMLVSMLVGVLRNTPERAPAKVLAALNSALAGQTQGGFVTCCAAQIGVNGGIVIANAGHPMPYLDGIEADLPPGLPLGVDASAVYGECELPLSRQMTLVSDGVIEATNARGELFGFERAREISAKSAATIAETARVWGQNDDITAVTIRRTA